MANGVLQDGRIKLIGKLMRFEAIWAVDFKRSWSEEIRAHVVFKTWLCVGVAALAIHQNDAL